VEVKSASNSTLGKIVVNSAERTLYLNTEEKHGSIKCNGYCRATWPPLLIAKGAKAKAGPGIGHPLYRYAGDTKAGTVNGEGIAAIWFAVKTDGVPAKPSGSGSTTSTTTTTSTGYGY
jgi:predicted lipoprotein with Yx(FWY)xxD motif